MFEGIFEITRRNMLMGTGSGAFFLSLFLLPAVCQSREEKYKFVYPVYTVVLLYSSYWVYTNVLTVILSYAPDRFVALIPVPFILALMISRGCCSVKGKERIIAVLAAALLIFYISDYGGDNFYDDLYKIENVYGLPQDVVDVCDLMLSEEEQPLILVNDLDVDYFRQYSADVKIVNVNLAGMSAVAETRSEYTQIQELMSDPGTIYMNLVGELAAECGVDYIILRVDAYQSVNYADELYYTLYEVIGDYLVFKIKA